MQLNLVLYKQGSNKVQKDKARGVTEVIHGLAYCSVRVIETDLLRQILTQFDCDQ